MKTKSLKARGARLSDTFYQLEVIRQPVNGQLKMTSFEDKLKESGLYPLKPTGLETLQVNLGKMCNQTCNHCHVDAGPDRKEIMSKETMEHCLNALKDSSIKTVDLTGGAPEMNPQFKWFVQEIRKLGPEVIVRSNLTILESNKEYKSYPQFFKEQKLIVVSSLPCYTADNTDKQRGDGVFESSIKALKALNCLGYGKAGSGLTLNLVYNPGGAFLPPSQGKLEQDYKRELKTQFEIEFNSLYTITNLPISRFLDYLLESGKYENYMESLIDAYNPAAAIGVMCRNTLSVGWDGLLYDCDFNQMLDLDINTISNKHISEFNQENIDQREIVIGQHCYGCTAGAGSSCTGILA